MGRYDQSRAFLERAKKVLACGGAQTLSKGWNRNPTDYPIYIHEGSGSHVTDIDKNEYLDYMGALGPIILGYAHPAVTEAVWFAAEQSPLFSLEHPLSVEVAEQLVQIIPGADLVRFVKTGSSAVSAAIRAARTYTNRNVVLVATNSYHGQDDVFQVTQAGRGEYGVPRNLWQNIARFEYNNLASLETAFDVAPGSVAAVLVEPARDFMATQEFMEGAKAIAHKHGALFIADEVVTFGRMSGLTASAYFGVTPDLMALGKAMANGYALGAVAGRRDVMQAFDKCFISGTYNGETIGLAAAKATLDILTTEPVVEHIWRQGATLMQGFNAAMERYDVPGKAEGIPPCFRQNFTGRRAAELKMAFMAKCAERGVLPGLITYPSYAHSDADVKQTVRVYYEVAEELERLLDEPMGV